MEKTVLLTGSNGFLGSHIADCLLRNGYEVRAMVRETSDLEWLKRKPVELVFASLDSGVSLRKAVEGVNAVIHNAGVVSIDNRYHYYLHNTEGTRNLLEAVLEAAPSIERFVHVSSQAAGGPTRGTMPRSEEDRPDPITAYGHSKLLAEKHVRSFEDKLPVTIIRPPSIYGPRDQAWLPLFKLVSRGFLPLVGNHGGISMTHGMDVARQVRVQMEHEAAIGQLFHAAPFAPVTVEEFGREISHAIGKPVMAIRIPDSLLRILYPAVYPILKAIGVKPPFRKDKLADVFASNWTISGDKARDLLGFEGAFPLRSGVGQTVEWYRWKQWVLSPRDRLKKKGVNKTFEKMYDGKMRTVNPTCDLCGLVFEGEIKTRKHFENEEFVIVDCLICNVPMAVLKDHRASFTDDEKQRLMTIFSEQFGGEMHPDFEQRRIPEHAHVHYRSTPHALPWQRRPD